VTIELAPSGFEPMRQTIATMHISNVSDLTDESDYQGRGEGGREPPDR
jgi:hypothetical protein